MIILHAVDNAEKEKEGNKDDRLFEVKLILDAAQANCLKIDRERIHSVD